MTTPETEFGRLLQLIKQGGFESACEILDEYLANNEPFGRLVAKSGDTLGYSLICHVAGKPGAAAIVERLLRLGADPNSTCGTDHILTIVISSGSEVGLDSLAELETLLKLGANPNAIAVGAGTLPILHFAIRENRLTHARVLLKYGADPRLKTKESGFTALDIAKRYGSKEARDMLRDFDPTLGQ